MIDKTRVTREFDRRAHSYDGAAHVQQDMAIQLIKNIDAMDVAPASILEIGCGTGMLTEMLVSRFPEALVTAIDIAPAMIARARERVATSNVSFKIGDAETISFESGAFDLVISNATIQWFTNPKLSIDNLARSLSSHGVMLHSTFGPATFRELFESYKSVERERLRSSSGRGLQLAPVERWLQILRDVGLREIVGQRRLVTLTYPNAREFLVEVKATGACYSPTRERDLTLLVDVLRRYDLDHKTTAGVAATYEIIELSSHATS